MEQAQFEKMMALAGALTPEQFKALAKAYADGSRQDQKKVMDTAVYTVSEQHLAQLGINNTCPYCNTPAPNKYGTNEAGIQQFVCTACRKHFTRFTGTLLEKSHYPWEVWVEVLKMTLADRSLEDMQTVLQQDYDYKSINLKTLHHMRMKLVYAMAAMPEPTLTGVIQMDESSIRESQKGTRQLVSYLKGEERKPRKGRHPSKYGHLGPEFATLLTAIDSRGFCVCKVVALGKAPTDAVIEMIEQYCIDPAYICSDANIIYEDACDLLNLPHYVRPSNYGTVLEHAGLLEVNRLLTPEEYMRNKAHNRAIMENLYRERQLDYISHREDLTYPDFKRITRTYHLSLARVNELHKDIKLMIEKKMTNVASKYLQAYMDFFSFRRNWRVEHGHSPANAVDAETILGQLLALKVNLTRREREQVQMTLPKPSGRAAQLLREQTEKARQITKNKYFKFDEEDVPSFNKREILLDAPHSRLVEIAKAHQIRGYTKLTHWGLAAAITKLPDIDTIIMDLVTRDRHYEIAEEDLKYLRDLAYAKAVAGVE